MSQTTSTSPAPSGSHLRIVIAICIAVIMVCIVIGVVVMEVTGSDHVTVLVSAVSAVVLPTVAALLSWREAATPTQVTQSTVLAPGGVPMPIVPEAQPVAQATAPEVGGVLGVATNSHPNG